MKYDYSALQDEIANAAVDIGGPDVREYWAGHSRETRNEYASELISRVEDNGEDRAAVLADIAQRIAADAAEPVE